MMRERARGPGLTPVPLGALIAVHLWGLWGDDERTRSQQRWLWMIWAAWLGAPAFSGHSRAAEGCRALLAMAAGLMLLLPWRWGLSCTLVLLGGLVFGLPLDATFWLFGCCLLIVSPLALDVAGRRRPAQVFGRYHVESLLPVSPIVYQRARAMAGAVAALLRSGLGLLMLQIWYWGHPGCWWPDTPLWVPTATVAAWAPAALLASRGPSLPAGEAPTVSHGLLRRLSASRVPRVADAWARGLVQSYPSPAAPYTLLDRRGLRWLGGWAVGAAALVAAFAAWYRVRPGDAGVLLVVAACCSTAAALVTAGLWPVPLQGELGVQSLLPYSPRRRWLQRFGAAAVLAGLAAGTPWALAGALRWLGADPVAVPQLASVPRVTAALALGLLGWWPLLPVEAVAARFLEWFFLITVFGGALGAGLVIWLAGRVGVPVEAVALALAPALAALSYRYCDPNAWPVTESRRPLDDASAAAFWVHVLLGVAAVHALYFAFGG